MYGGDARSSKWKTQWAQSSITRKDCGSVLGDHIATIRAKSALLFFLQIFLSHPISLYSGIALISKYLNLVPSNSRGLPVQLCCGLMIELDTDGHHILFKISITILFDSEVMWIYDGLC